MSSIPQEIELLERVLLRFGNADTDAQLEDLLGKFLTPVILKITSPNEKVRTKVLEVLTHIKRRITSRSQVQLPVEALLDQYKSAASSPFLQNFAVVFITIGYPRLTIDKQTALAPKVLLCEEKSETYQDKLFTLLLPVFGDIKVPDEVDERNLRFPLDDKPIIKRSLLSLFQDVLLLPYGATPEQNVPPGMSVHSFQRVIVNKWRAEELEKVKCGVVRFISAGIFTEAEIFICLVLASADTRFSVANPSTAELSKVCTLLDFSQPDLMAPLYTLFLGNTTVALADRRTNPCCVRLRQKLLQYLIKCRERAINVPRGIQVIFESLFGETTNKRCKVLALQFAERLIKDGPLEIVSKVAKVLLGGFLKIVKADPSEPADVQNAANSALAQLVHTSPSAVSQDLEIVHFYFDYLAAATPDLHTSIRDTLVALAQAFAWKGATIGNTSASDVQLSGQQHLLLAMLSDYAESKLPLVQNATSAFLATCYPEHFAPTRLLLLFIAAERNSLRENVTSLLYGSTKKDNINYENFKSAEYEAAHAMDTDDVEDSLPNTSKVAAIAEPTDRNEKCIMLPTFTGMMRHVHKVAQQRLDKNAHVTVGRTKLPFSLEACEEILDYLRLCLWSAAGVRYAPGANEKHTGKLRHYIIEQYDDTDVENEMRHYLFFVQNTLEAKRFDTNLLCAYDLLKAAPEQLSVTQTHMLPRLAETLRDVSDTLRMHVAQLYGVILAYGCDDSAFNAKIAECLSTLPQLTLEHKHGWLLVLGHSFQRKLQRHADNPTASSAFCASPQFTETIKVIAKMLCESQWLLVSAAIQCVSMIAKETAIPNVEVEIRLSGTSDDTDGDKEATPETTTAQGLTKVLIFEAVLTLLRRSSTRAKIREQAAICLGHLAIGDRDYFVSRNLAQLLALIDRQMDMALNIAISEAIISTLNGRDTQSQLPPPDVRTRLECDDATFESFVSQLIRLVPKPNPYVRQSCSVWLLAIVKHCSHRPALIRQQQLLQYAFIHLLSDNSEFVQDVASRGLAMIFSLSDAQSQNALTESLLEQLIGGKREVGHVDANTEIFPEGMLGKAPTGGNISTYKELCSLASDMNKPDMIYEFMQLVNHNAAWTSKLGAAFGVKSLSIDFDSKLKPYLPKIVPRLYRYKYDPTPKIQNSMISIWDSIVPNANATMEEYYWPILRELLDNLNFKEWRVRIACCLGVRDLLRSPTGLRLRSDQRCGGLPKDAEQPMHVDLPASAEVTPEPELTELWIKLFRVMDDVHEGTRNAAQGTVKLLSKLCVTAASVNNGKSGQVVTGAILPFILEHGITHTVVEIRRISIKTVSELIDSSGSLITPHLVTLIPALLNAIGELESTKLAYLSTRLGSDVEAQETVDTLRTEVAKSTEAMEAITKCVRFIEYPALEAMTPGVLEVGKTTVSISSKAAIAHFICLVAIQIGKEMTPLVGKYLRACFAGLQDRNATVRKNYAVASGHLIGIAKVQTIKSFFVKLNQAYLENSSNQALALAVHYINKRHHDLLKDYLESVVPLIFFAMHEDPNEQNRANVEQWKDLWNEISPGDVSIAMNIDAIMERVEQSFGDDSWTRKAQAANCIATIATRLKQNNSLTEATRFRLILLLLTAMQGRTFQGKERLVQALAALCKGWDSQQDLATRIVEATMRECRKKDLHYRTHALAALGDILDELKLDYFEEVYNMTWHLIEIKDHRKAFGSDDEDMPQTQELTTEQSSQRAHTLNKLKETICDTLGKAWPHNAGATQAKYQLQFAASCAACLKESTRSVQVNLLRALVRFVERLLVFDGSPTEQRKEKIAKVDSQDQLVAAATQDVVDKICSDILLAVEYSAGMPYTGIKKESLQIILALIKRLANAEDKRNLQKVKDVFEENLTKYKKDSAPEVRCRLKNIEEEFAKITF